MDSLTRPLLVVDDSDIDFEILQSVVSRTVVDQLVFRCTDGDEALSFLFQTGEYADPDTAPRPGVILLDLNLPGTEGLDVLARVKQDDQLKSIPIVVLTSSTNPDHIKQCYQRGASSYVVKAMNTQKFIATLQSLIHFWLESAVLSYSEQPWLSHRSAFPQC